MQRREADRDKKKEEDDNGQWDWYLASSIRMKLPKKQKHCPIVNCVPPPPLPFSTTIRPHITPPISVKAR